MDRLTLTLPDGRTLRMCFSCGVNEHERCADDPAICNGCAICLARRSDYAIGSGS